MTSPKPQMARRNSGNHSDDSLLGISSPNSLSRSSSPSGSSNSLANTPAPTFDHDEISLIGPAASSARGRSNLRGRRSSSVSAKRVSSSRSSSNQRPQSVPPPKRRDNGEEQEEHVTPTTPTGKISRSAIWKHMTMVEGSDNQIICNLCPTERLPNGKPKNVFAYHGTTTTHITHLRRQHGNVIDVRDFPPESSGSSPSVHDYMVEGRFGKKIMPCPSERAKAITAALTGVIYLDLRPASFVEGRGIRWLLHVLEPRYIVPDRTTLMRTHLVDHYHNVKKVVIDKLEDSIHLSLGSDLWTDDHRRLGYLSVIVSFITSDWKFLRFVLSNRHLDDRHTGKNIADAINKTMQEFGLASAKPTYVTDEGANMKCAGQILKYPRAPCVAHKIDSAISVDTLSQIPEIVAIFLKLANILTFFRYKAAEVTKKQKELKALLDAIPEDVDESNHNLQDHCYAAADTSNPQKITTLKKDCKTRWNSKCIQIQSILDNFRVINELLDYHKSDQKITHSERKLLQQLLEFLKTFQESSELMQRDLTPEISNVLPTIACMKLACYVRGEDMNTEFANMDELPTRMEKENQHCDDDEEDYDPPVQHPILIAVKKKMFDALQKRFADFEEDPQYKLASTLDPRWKTSFGYKFEDDFIRGIDGFETSIGRVSAGSEVLPTTETQSSSTTASPDSHQSGSKRPASQSQLSVLMSKMRKRNPPMEDSKMLRMEVATYLAIPDIAEHQMADFNLLLWWKDRQSMFPKLSIVARKVFSIMPSAAMNERLNSTAGRTLTADRSCLAPQNVDMSLFLFYNTPPEMYASPKLADALTK